MRTHPTHTHRAHVRTHTIHTELTRTHPTHAYPQGTHHTHAHSQGTHAHIPGTPKVSQKSLSDQGSQPGFQQVAPHSPALPRGCISQTEGVGSRRGEENESREGEAAASPGPPYAQTPRLRSHMVGVLMPSSARLCEPGQVTSPLWAWVSTRVEME